MVSSYEMGYSDESGSRWNPANWTRRIWLIVVTAVVVVVVAIVGAVVGVRATQNNSGGNSSYPDYSKLNYTLIDTCEWAVRLLEGILRGKGLTSRTDSGSSFFDKFDYFNTYDPGMSSFINIILLRTDSDASSCRFCALCRPKLRRTIRERTSTHPPILFLPPNIRRTSPTQRPPPP
jgi:hypothetical protein